MEYSLHLDDYSWKNAVVWQNFAGHVKAAKEARVSGDCKGRIIHNLIAIAEFLPILSQLASIIELLVVRIFKKSQVDEKKPLIAETIDSGEPINPNKILTDELLEKQNILNQRKVPLRVNPAIPIKEYSVDMKRASEWIEACDGDSKNLAKKLLQNIQHITFKQLEDNLRICVQKLNRHLNESHVKEYSIGLSIGKSQQWVASLAIENLDVLPSSHFTLGDQGTVITASYHGPNNFVPKSELTASKVKEKAMVIFDDSSYSGTQLAGNLHAIDRALKDKKKMYVIVPFLSTRAKEFLEHTKFHNLNVVLITSDFSIKMLSDIFTEEELNLVDKICQINRYQTLCYTDWRLPDPTSTYSGLSQGLYSLTADGESKFTRDAKIKDELRMRDYSFRLVPNKIPRPYGLTMIL